jgi:uncharacterized protein (TIGR03118 family)
MSGTKCRPSVACCEMEALEPRALFAASGPMMMPTMGGPAVGPLIDYGGVTPPPATDPGSNTGGTPKRRNKHDAFNRLDLVSNGGVPAARTDPDLVNSWGLAVNPAGFWWMANQGTGVSTQLDAAGEPAPDESDTPPFVDLPGPGGAPGGFATGVVFNGGNNFVVSQDDIAGPSRFIYVGVDGVISGWNPDVNFTETVLAVDRSTAAEPAAYTGAALASAGGQDRLYAVDFNNGRIDVFDGNFNPVTTAGGFQDPKLPKGGYIPFNIQNLGGNLFVTYAIPTADHRGELRKKGLGVIDVFDADGNLVRRFAKKGNLNAPWAVAQAPADFGKFSNSVIVGNFGDGKVMAFDAKGKFKGFLRDAGTNKPVQIDGLWGLAFGNGLQAGPTNTLFFAAGPNEEADGLFGSLTLAT